MTTDAAVALLKKSKSSLEMKTTTGECCYLKYLLLLCYKYQEF